MKKISALILALTLVFQLTWARPALAADGEEIGLWIASGFLSLIYTPFKAAFFLIMGIGGGLSTMVTVPIDEVEASTKVIKWGFYGDWLIRPDHLRQEATPRFIGFEEKIRFVFLPPDEESGRLLKAEIPQLNFL